ncbi:MAG: hypothetical protein O3A01_02410 [bacterium]|nr:hypothetical protein [bacterium]
MLSIFKNGRLVFLITVLLGIQLMISFARIGLPFTDGRLHVHHNNASQLRQALHSNSLPNATGGSVLGVANVEFDTKGEVKSVRNTLSHPILSSILFKLHTKLFGYSEWVPRTFALLFSMTSTVLLFCLLFLSTKSMFASWFLSLLYVVLPLNSMYQDQWQFYHLNITLLLGALILLSRQKSHPYNRPLFLTLLGLSLLADWPSYFAVVMVWSFLFFKRRVPEFQRLHTLVLWVGLGCGLLNFLILNRLGLNLDLIKTQFIAVFNAGMVEVGSWMWLLKQFVFLDFNFGQINVALFIMLLIYVVGVRLFWGNILFFSSSVMLFTGVILVTVFRTYSFTHHYAQVYLALAYVLLLGGVLINVKQKIWIGRHLQFLGISIVIPMLLMTCYNSYMSQSALQHSSFGQTQDLEIIKAMDMQIVYAPGSSGPESWWGSSVIQLYTDKYYKGTGKRMVPASGVVLNALNPDTQVIVVHNRTDRAAALRFFQRKFKVRELRVYRRSPNFTFYRFTY